MASYEPPTANYPTFDSLVFQSPNSGSLTIADGDARYLGRTNVATSVATTTAFGGDVSIGSSLFEYTPGLGLDISGTANGESIFMDVLSAGGVQRLKLELNPGHTHIYDQIRITDSDAPTNYTLLQQILTTLNVNNQIAGSTTNFLTKTAGGAAVTPLSLSSTAVTMGLPITLDYTTTPAAGQIGFRTKTVATASTAISTNSIITLITGGFSLVAGTYLITLNGHITTTAVAGTVTSYELGISTANNSFTGGFVDAVLGTYSVPAVAGVITGQTTEVLNVTATTTYFFNHRLIFATVVPTISTANTFIQYTRIA